MLLADISGTRGYVDKLLTSGFAPDRYGNEGVNVNGVISANTKLVMRAMMLAFFCLCSSIGLEQLICTQ